MKYIILNDLHFLLKKYSKIVFMYLFVCLLYFYFTRNIYVATQEFVVLNSVLALSINLNELISNPIIGSLIIANFLLFVGLAIVIYKNDMENYDNFFFRISLTKWVISKIIVMFITMIFINLIIFLNVILSKTVGFEYFIVMFKKVIITSSLITLVYLVLMFYNKFKVISFFILFLLIGIIFIGFNIYKINMLFAILCWNITFSIIILASKFIKFSDLKG